MLVTRFSDGGPQYQGPLDCVEVEGTKLEYRSRKLGLEVCNFYSLQAGTYAPCKNSV